MLLKLTPYDIDVRYVPGKQQIISDCLSRAPIDNLDCTDCINDVGDEIGVNLVISLGMEETTLSKFRDATSVDDTSVVVMNYVMKCWPGFKDQGDELVREYWSY